MYKKIISILLCLCILSGFATVASAAPNTTKANVDKYEIIEIFKALDMLSDDYDAVTIEWQKPVTNAEFAFLTANVLKRDYVGGEQLYYHDVSKQHWAFSSVSTLVECGLLEVGPEKRFNPTENITREEAVSVMLKALGYRFDFNDNGYLDVMSIANSTGITNDVSGVDQLTFSDVIYMLYNTLIAEVLEISGLSGSSGVYSTSGKTYLEKEYSISFKKGILEGFDGTSFTGEAVDEGMALISGAEYEAQNIDLREMLGCSMLYIYEIYDDENLGRVIWAKKEKTEELIIYYADSRVNFDASTYELTYYENSSRRKKVDISKTVDVIYNDEYVSFGIEDLLSRDMYSIKLIKNSGDKEYSKVILSSYENMVVGAVDEQNQWIYDKMTKEYMPLNNVDRLVIIKDGRKVGLTDLKAGDVLSVYTSESGESIRIEVSTNVVKGNVAAKRVEDGYEYITIGDNKYRWYKNESSYECSINMPVSLYLDVNGFIAYAEKYIAQGNLAYMIDIKLDGSEEFITVEMFKADGKIVKVNTTEELRIDGAKYKYAEDAFGALGGKEFKSSLALYKEDVNGLITHIYFPSTENDAELKLLQSNVSGTYRDTGRIGRKTFINDKTMIFAIPRNPKDASYGDFERFSKSGMKGDSSYVYSTYTLADDVGYEEIMVLHNYEHKSDQKGLLVTEIYMGLNNDDEAIYILEGYSGTNYETIKCAPSCSAENVREGMYITYNVKNDGSMSSFTVRCDYEGGITPLDKDLHKTTTFSSGYVNKVIGEIARIGDASGENFDTIYNFTSSVPVLVYYQDGTVKVGSVADLKSYEAVGNNCSFVFTHIRHGGPTVYVIYD